MRLSEVPNRPIHEEASRAGVRLLGWFPLMGENHGEHIKQLVVSLIK